MNPYTDALVSWLHFVLIFAVLATLVMELTLCRAPLNITTLRRLVRIDAVYGLSALGLLIAGFTRALYFGKTWAFYSVQLWFWVKIGLFALIGLVSIIPTVQFLQWTKAIRKNPAFEMPTTTIQKLRICIHIELILLPFIVFAAVMMARGL